MQTILGAGGAAGTELAKSLIAYTKEIKLVSRTPKKVNSTDILFEADLSIPEKLDEAVKDSEVVYVTIAFEYKTQAWKEKWPIFMQNLIKACKKYNSKIVFVDNMYMYDINCINDMTENTPINPGCKKGEVRADIYKTLMNAVDKGDVNALVARGADFYGPHVLGSYFTQLVTNNLTKNKNPQWIGNPDAIHNFTYSKDIGKALSLLGNTPDAYNQVWHLPTYQGKLTSRQWIEIFLKEMKKDKKIQVVPDWVMTVMGMFVPVLKELKDISYQTKRDYFFNSSKFNNRFNFVPTTPENGIKEVVKLL